MSNPRPETCKNSIRRTTNWKPVYSRSSPGSLGDDIVMDAGMVPAMAADVHPRPDQFRQQDGMGISTSTFRTPLRRT
jgi:hypothetical protein